MDTKNFVTRGNYGEILSPTTNPTIAAAKKLLAKAIESGYLERPYVDVDKKHRGSALNHDVYDASASSVLIQRRKTICHKHGNSPTKDYLCITRRNGNLVVTEVSDSAKPMVVKRCKASHALGEAIEVLERTGDIFTPPTTCMMIVEVSANGRYQTICNAMPILRSKLSVAKSGYRFACHANRQNAEARARAIQKESPQKSIAIIEGKPFGFIRKSDFDGVFTMSAFRFTREIERISILSPNSNQGEQ